MRTSCPTSKTEILDSLAALRDPGLRFWSELDPSQFASALGDAWSPADNLRHLTKSTRPVAEALQLPLSELGLRFGISPEPSRPFEQLRETYIGLLSQGATAGRFAPSPVEPPSDRRAWQLELVAGCADAVSALEQALEDWGESDLDRYGLSHPLLGRLTIREMLLFTLYHFEHHKATVVRRMAASGQPPN